MASTALATSAAAGGGLLAKLVESMERMSKINSSKKAMRKKPQGRYVPTETSHMRLEYVLCVEIF